MKAKLLAVATILSLSAGPVALPGIARAQTIPDAAHTLNARLTAKLRPSLRSWVDQQVIKAQSNAQTTDATIIGDARAGLSNSGLGSADIDALAFIVMMQVALDADKELRATLDAMNAANKKKAAFREAKEHVDADLAANARARNIYVMDAPPMTAGRVDRAVIGNIARVVVDSPKSLRDTYGELGDLASMRLQVQMDRRSKLISTVSNLLKKISETESSITQNLK